MFISTEHTPNPEAMRFDPHVALTSGAAWSFDRADFDAARSPLAAALFAVHGVRSVYIAAEFLTISREPGGPAWEELRYQVIAVIADHLATGAPAVAVAVAVADANAGGDAPIRSSEIETEIRSILALHVAPGVARDGGEILFDRFDADSGVLWIKMRGACGGCPSAQLTLRAGVESVVRRHVPEVHRVEQTPATAPAEDATRRMSRWFTRVGQSLDLSARTVFTHAGKEVRRKSIGPQRHSA